MLRAMIGFPVVDIHSHILWDVDDGSSSLDESLEILACARQAGTTDIVATPHLNAEFTQDPDLLEQRVRELSAKTGGRPRVHRGSELSLTLEGVENVLRCPKLFTINATQYLLVEIPDVHVGKHVEGVLKHLVGAGLIPIVAHPERNPVLQRTPQMLEAWAEAGCLVQLTALSITGGFGAAAKVASAWLLQRGLAHVVASDCHDPLRRHPRLDEAFATVSSRYGAEYAEILFRDNPECIIHGIQLAGGRQRDVPPTAAWWRVWR